ncbi:IclR family transcriptional regulator [Halarchaeum nitratireducens]|uniref:IclR family transcriptional regulator n=2 Tax=Halarchaeum nitratireducens TaxID=489913 RepID=A0A830G8T1_9EURY|nr:IclR family transcriptional regulator [Halarchaeum nitratireducens]
MGRMAGNTEDRKIQSVDRTCDILQELGESGGSTVSELAEGTDLTPGTVHTHLSTLASNGFVQQVDGEYKLGMEFVPFGEWVRRQSPLYRAAKTEVDDLAHEYDAVAHLVTEYRGKTLTLYEMAGEEAVGKEVHTAKRGRPQTHIHCTAGGKAILAYLPEERTREIIDDCGLPPYTSHTVTDEETLFAELETIREQEYAINHEEVVHGNRAIGAPVLDDDGTILGSISMSGPASKWRDERFQDELVDAVVRAANSVEINIHTADRSP